MPTISLDYETYYNTKADYGIKSQGMTRYCYDDRFDPYMISVSDGADTWAGEPKHFNWNALEGATLLSHNAHFDSTVYEAMVAKNLAPQVKFADWLCTANLTSFLCNRRDLASASKFLLGVEVDKGMRNYMDGKTWQEAINEGKSEALLQYARGDAIRCFQFYAKFGHFWPAIERRASALTINQGKRGVRINVALLDQYRAVAQQMLIDLVQNLPWKDHAKPTSTKAIAEQCRTVGIPCPPVKSHEDGEELFAEWEKLYKPVYPWVAAVADWRSVNKFLGSLDTIKARMMGDIFPFSLKYFGAHTGRWSGDAGLNLQNLRKEPILRGLDGLMITGDKLAAALGHYASNKKWPDFVTAVLDIRQLFIPREGTKFMISDLAQIEPRCLAWLAGDTTFLSLISTGQSPYEAHARASMNWTGGTLKKENKDLYALAKARLLALGYQCGWEKFIDMARDVAGLDITTEDPEWIDQPDGTRVSGYGKRSKEIVADYRSQNPLVADKERGLWARLDRDFKASAGSTFEVELPSGRKLRYPHVRHSTRTEIDEETGKPRMKRVCVADVGGRIKILYGGLITENITQAVARDVFMEGLLRMEDAGLPSVFTVHDETINEVPLDTKPKDCEALLSVTPEWLPGCPIAAESVESMFYLK